MIHRIETEAKLSDIHYPVLIGLQILTVSLRDIVENILSRNNSIKNYEECMKSLFIPYEWDT